MNKSNTPLKKPFLTAEWQWLAMLNYEVPPEILVPWLPHGVELDPWQGRTLVSLVGFRFLNTRVMGLPVPGHRNFDEVNLRSRSSRKSSRRNPFPHFWRKAPKSPSIREGVCDERQ